MSPSAAIIATEQRPALSTIERVPAEADYGTAAEPGWRGFDWSASERDALIAGRRVRYLDVGEGRERAFALVHGMGGRWQHWLETIPSLAQHGRVLAIDLPGFGRSESPAAPPSLDGFADIAAELAQSLGIERVVLIGHSMGGPIAVRFAARHPGLVEAIALVAGAVYQFSDLLSARRVPYWLAARPRETAAIATELLTAGLPAPAALRRLIVRTPALRRMVLSPYVMDPNALPADVISLVVDGAGARGVLPTVAAISRSDAREDMDQVSCPVLSIAGDRDRIVPLADTEALRRDMPAAHSVVLEGCGHMLMLERPEAFNRRLLDFVTTLDEPV